MTTASDTLKEIDRLDDLVCLWDFQEPPGHPFRSRGPYAYELTSVDGEPGRIGQGVFGPQSVQFGDGAWLRAARSGAPALNLAGPNAQMSILAWLMRAPGEDIPGCEAVAGMWNEHGKRQYCLFLNLGIWDSAQQAAAHVSGTGGATPGHKYCMEAAIGRTPVSRAEWHFIAATYDGEFARIYLDGSLDEREGLNPYAYRGGLYGTGLDGADFTVGAVARPDWVGEDFTPHGHVIANRFHGALGGLAVLSRAVTRREIAALWRLTAPLCRRVA